MKSHIIPIKSNNSLYNNQYDKEKFANVIALRNEDFLLQAERRKEDNERNDTYSYHDFSDEEILYYYLNRQTHFDKEKRIKDTSRLLYSRDLSQFYFFIQEHSSFLQMDVEHYIEGKVWINLRKRHIRNYQHWLAEDAISSQSHETYKPATISRKLRIIRSFLKWLYEIEYIKEPLYIEILSTSVTKKHKPRRELSYEEVKELLYFYRNNPINYALLSILATTGLRVAEIAGARWGDLEYDTIRERYYLYVNTKGDSERIVPINKEVLQRIVNFRKRRRLPIQIGIKHGGTIFQTKHHTAYKENYLSQYITKIIKETNLPFTKDMKITPHFFRHFYVQYLYDYKKLPPHIIAAAVGHKDDRTTKENYLKQRLLKDHDAGNLIDEDEF